MPPLLDVLIALFLLIGAGFALIGALGLAKLPDFYTRLHAPTKATTLGVGGLIIASMIYFSSRAPGLSLHELLLTIFLFISAPVTAHMLTKTALHQRVKSADHTTGVDD